MDKLLAICVIFFLLSCDERRGCEPVTFHFANKRWAFPSTVEEAVKKHNLAYHPPGYYYQTDTNSYEVLLSYHSKWLDFSNDIQPKETLYPRDVHTYVFQFKAGPNTYDSLRNDLESRYSKGLKPKSYVLEEHERPFQFNLLEINECLTVGIKNSKSQRFGKIVTVQFIYGLSLGDIGVQMGSY
jgi:hypothetical protein